jgi:aminoglycoside phosphotransferase (APT) family kinase protein
MISPEVLAHVPGCEDLRPPQAVQPLPGGQGRNQVLRIDTTAGSFVLRRRLGRLDRPGALAITELTVHRAAAAAGLAPRIVAAAPDGRWMLMEFVDQPPWTEAGLRLPGAMERLGGRLALLQSLEPPTAVPVADAPAMAEGYLARLRERDPAAAHQLEPAIDTVRQLTAELEDFGQRSVLAHGDPMVSNMLGPLPVLVDWEYAQLADPTWDFACLLSYYPYLAEGLPRLLASAGLDHPRELARFNLQRRRFDLLNSLWERAYPAVG